VNLLVSEHYIDSIMHGATIKVNSFIFCSLARLRLLRHCL